MRGRKGKGGERRSLILLVYSLGCFKTLNVTTLIKKFFFNLKENKKKKTKEKDNSSIISLDLTVYGGRN